MRQGQPNRFHTSIGGSQACGRAKGKLCGVDMDPIVVAVERYLRKVGVRDLRTDERKSRGVMNMSNL
jgi:hypothetical protein